MHVAISSLGCTVQALWILGFYRNLLGISQTTFRRGRVRFRAFFWTTFAKTAVYCQVNYIVNRELLLSENFNIFSLLICQGVT